MRSQFVVIGSIVLAVAVARDNRASACSTTNDDTDLTDQQFFMCQGEPESAPGPDQWSHESRDPPSISLGLDAFPSRSPPQAACRPTFARSCLQTVKASRVPMSTHSKGPVSTSGRSSFRTTTAGTWTTANGTPTERTTRSTMISISLTRRFLSSAYLAYFGLKDNENLMFHGTQDYVNLLRANGSIWHDEFFPEA